MASARLERISIDEQPGGQSIAEPLEQTREIPLFKVHMPESVLKPLAETLLSGYIGQGARVTEFEQALGSWFGNDRVLTVNAGTSAIQLALRLANVGVGDEVISTPMTCSASNVPIMATGA